MGGGPGERPRAIPRVVFSFKGIAQAFNSRGPQKFALELEGEATPWKGKPPPLPMPPTIPQHLHCSVGPPCKVPPCSLTMPGLVKPSLCLTVPLQTVILTSLLTCACSLWTLASGKSIWSTLAISGGNCQFEQIVCYGKFWK